MEISGDIVSYPGLVDLVHCTGTQTSTNKVILTLFNISFYVPLAIPNATRVAVQIWRVIASLSLRANLCDKVSI